MNSSVNSFKSVTEESASNVRTKSAFRFVPCMLRGRNPHTVHMLWKIPNS